MSKLLKIIAGILIAVFVLSSLALLVPPLLGIQTIVSKPALDTNISMGTVVYATRKPVTNIYTGDEIVYEDETSAYLYKVEQVNVADGEIYVSNETDKTEGIIRTGSSAMQKMLAIPFIGYILIALESSEGLILIGLGVAFLITLLILGEVIDRRHRNYDDEDDEELDDEEYFSGIAKSVNEPHKLDALTSGSPSATGAIAAPAAAEPAAAETDLAATRAVVIEEPGKTEETEKAVEEAENDAEETVEKAAETAENTEEAAKKSAETAEGASETQEAEETVPEKESVVTPETAAAAVAGSAVMAEETAEETQAQEPEELDEIAKAEAEAKAAQARLEELKAAAAAKAKGTEAKAEETVKAREEVRFKPEDVPAVAKEVDADLAVDIDQIPDEEDSAAKHDLNESELPGVEAALEAALATTQVSRSTQVRKPVQQEEATEAAAEELDEIELAIPVKTLDEYLQVAYTNGDDPQVIKDNTTGVSLVDFSDCFKKQ